MKTKKIFWLAFLVAVLFSFSCNWNPFHSDKDNSYSFKYAAFDSTGVKAVEGNIFIKIDSINVSGSWDLKKLKKEAVVGPQEGEGALAGILENGELRINLNPNMVDNNVLLNAAWNENKLSGVWSYVGFPGVINSGTFVGVSF